MNTVLELDFAIDRSGRVEPSHAALYKAFGDWRRSCYGTPVASGALNHTGAGAAAAPYSLEVTAPTTVDRVVLAEDQRHGQRILQYRVTVKETGAVFANGTAVGNKRILLGANVTGTLRLEVLSTALGLPPLVTMGAYAPCPSG